MVTKYLSSKAIAFSYFRSRIACIIRECLRESSVSVPALQLFVDGTVNVIHQLEAMLRHNNVRVREHVRLGSPALPDNPNVRNLVKRFENTVRVLCLLAECIEEGKGPAVTKEETQAINEGEEILRKLLENVYEAFVKETKKGKIE